LEIKTSPCIKKLSTLLILMDSMHTTLCSSKLFFIICNVLAVRKDSLCAD
jgi:hypothetical protein